jgi:queuosine precursor transporter
MKDKIHEMLSKLKLDRMQATIVLCSIYVFFSFAGNIAATKVIDLGYIPWFGRFIMDAGIIYSLTFTWRDLIHKQLGKKAAITTIYIAGIINLIAAIYFQIVVLLPSESSWALAGGQTAWHFLFGIQLRVVIGSILAQIVSELVDTKTYHVWTTGIGKGKPQWLRVVVSNALSVPVDSILFPIIAFAGIVNTVGIIQMFFTNIVIKAVITALSMWMIYLVPEKKIYTK